MNLIHRESDWLLINVMWIIKHLHCFALFSSFQKLICVIFFPALLCHLLLFQTPHIDCKMSMLCYLNVIPNMSCCSALPITKPHNLLCISACPIPLALKWAESSSAPLGSWVRPLVKFSSSTAANLGLLAFSTLPNLARGWQRCQHAYVVTETGWPAKQPLCEMQDSEKCLTSYSPERY